MRDAKGGLGCMLQGTFLMVLFFVPPAVYGQSNSSTLSSRTIEEIIVTSTKRTGTLKESPLSIAVIGEESIRKRGLVSMDDYLRATPGVSMQDRGSGQNAIIMRGIASDPQGDLSTAGVYFGETPLTNAGGFRGGSPDIKLIDIERVEVLRGPQGTLWGEGSMAGTVRIIPNRPLLDEFQAVLSGGLSDTSGKGDQNSSLQGVLNIPIVEDELAVRATVYQIENSGYFENIAASDPVKSSGDGAVLGAGLSNSDDIGSSDYSGIRLSALWQPSDDFTAQLTFMNQELEQDGLPEGSLSLGKFQQARFNTATGLESNDHDIDLLNLEFTWDLDWAQLFLSSARTETQGALNRDFSAFMVPILGADVPVLLGDFMDIDRDTHEFRFSSEFGRWNSLLGIYYADAEGTRSQRARWGGGPVDPVFGGALLLNGDQSFEFKDQALFGELSYALTDKLTATVGYRYYDYERDQSFIGDGVLIGGPTMAQLSLDDDNTSLKFNLSYAQSEDVLYYAEVQEGYRAGSAAGEPPAVCDIDGDGLLDGLGMAAQDLEPDDLTSYEIGQKLSVAGGRFQLRSAAYFIKWEGMPVALTADCGFIFGFNSGESESKGVETEGSALIGNNWTIDFGYSYTNVELSRGGALGNSGDRLPGSPENIFNIGVEYTFPLMGYDGYGRVDWNSVDDYYNTVGKKGMPLGDYNEVRLSLGLKIDNFDFQLFVDNATDADEIVWNDTEIGDGRVYRLRPRTIGLTTLYRF